jgi:hypothetical protein
VKPMRLEWEEQRLLHQPLTLESQMPTAGVIFSDGVEADHLDFNSGAIATIGLAPEKANLLVL